MIENVQGNYIDNAINMLDQVLAGRPANDLLHKVRRQLMLMKERPEFVPDYGRFLVDVEMGQPFVAPLLEVVEWRKRALARAKRPPN